MPAAPGATPRKMLPPPITTPISTPRRAHFRDLGDDALDGLAVDAVGVVAHQRLARQLEQDALVGGRLRHGGARLAVLGLRATSAAKSLLLLDALADHDTAESRQPVAFLAFSILLDGLLVVLDERLAEQRDLGRGTCCTAPSTIFATISAGLPDSCARCPRAIVALASRSARPAPRPRQRNRLARGDVHREVLAERVVAAVNVDQHADLRPPCR